jgi:hypothetical protein
VLYCLVLTSGPRAVLGLVLILCLALIGAAPAAVAEPVQVATTTTVVVDVVDATSYSVTITVDPADGSVPVGDLPIAITQPDGATYQINHTVSSREPTVLTFGPVRGGTYSVTARYLPTNSTATTTYAASSGTDTVSLPVPPRTATAISALEQVGERLAVRATVRVSMPDGSVPAGYVRVTDAAGAELQVYNSSPRVVDGTASMLISVAHAGPQDLTYRFVPDDDYTYAPSPAVTGEVDVLPQRTTIEGYATDIGGGVLRLVWIMQPRAKGTMTVRVDGHQPVSLRFNDFDSRFVDHAVYLKGLAVGKTYQPVFTFVPDAGTDEAGSTLRLSVAVRKRLHYSTAYLETTPAGPRAMRALMLVTGGPYPAGVTGKVEVVDVASGKTVLSYPRVPLPRRKIVTTVRGLKPGRHRYKMTFTPNAPNAKTVERASDTSTVVIAR